MEKTAFIIVCVVVVLLVLSIAFFTSEDYLRDKLSDKKQDLEIFSSYKGASELISEIESYLPKEVSSEDGETSTEIKPITTICKVKVVSLLLRSSKFLGQRVPCYYEHGRRIPSIEEMSAENSPCYNCKANCSLHP